MIFWILLAVFIIITVGLFMWEISDYDFYGISLFSGFAGGIMLLLYAGFATSAASEPGSPIKSEVSNTYQLEAIGTASSGDDFYLLAGQEPGESRSLSFVAPDNDTQFLSEASAEYSTIRVLTDQTEPYVIITSYVFENPVWVPWTTGGHTTYEFFVPANGVLEDYEVGK